LDIEFYFDLGSPTAYLAHCRLHQLCDRYDATVVHRPMLLGGVFKAAGSNSPIAVPAKGRYMLEQDLPRFAARYGVPLKPNPFFPVNTLPLMRGVFAARDLDCEESYICAMFDAMWVQARNLGDPAEAIAVMEAAGLDAATIVERSADASVKQRLIEATEEAVARGVFGAPTIFIGKQMFFGQDRLDFVEELLRR